MDITIQGANGHVKRKTATADGAGAANNEQSAAAATGDRRSLQSRDSAAAATISEKPMDSLRLPSLDCDKMGYSSDMSIGRGMDISIRGDGCVGDDNKELYDWRDAEGGAGGGVVEPAYYDSKEKIELYEQDACEKQVDGGSLYDVHEEVILPAEGRGNVEEVLEDPIDDVVVERCCPDICYSVCPCCIGDPDSPFWDLWYRHRLQVSRYFPYFQLLLIVIEYNVIFPFQVN